MGARRRAASGRRIAASAAISLAICGCGDLLGFRDANNVECLLASDCPDSQICSDGTCTVQCRQDKDCRSDEGTEGVCVSNTCEWPHVADDAGVGVAQDAADAPSGEDAAIEGGASIECEAGFGSCGDSGACAIDFGTDPSNCGHCDSPCSTLACIDGRCGTRATYGYSPPPDAAAPTASMASGLGPHAYSMFGISVRVTTPGVAVAIGMISFFGSEHVFVGLYSDSGGQPDQRLTSTPFEFQLPGTPYAANAEVVEVSMPVWRITSVSNETLGDPYWVIVESDQTVELQANSTAVTWYAHSLADFAQLPEIAPSSSNNPSLLTPALYLVMAQ